MTLATVLLGVSALAASEGGADFAERAAAAARQGDLNAAIAIAQQGVERHPRSTTLHYSLACFHALAADPGRSLEALEQSLEAGFDDVEWMQVDEDLTGVRAQAGFARLVARLEQDLTERAAKSAITLREGRWERLELSAPGRDMPRVNVELSYDVEAFRLRARVHDRHCRDGDRSWRYGDGFTVNLALPTEEEGYTTAAFSAYGFSLEKGRAVAVLINLDGAYYLRPVPELEPRIECRPEAAEVDYTITVPWASWPRLRPLLDQRAGLNLIYASQGDDGQRTLVKLIDDDHYDSEAVLTRRFVPLRFEPSPQSPLQLTGSLAHRLARGPRVPLDLAIWAPEAVTLPLEIVVSDADRNVVARQSHSLALAGGRTVRREDLELPGAARGTLEVEARLGDSLVWRESFARLEPDLVQRLGASLRRAGTATADRRAAYDVLALRLRLSALEAALADLGPRDDPEPIVRRADELAAAVGQAVRGRPLIVEPGHHLAAFESSRDGSLQRMSLYLPEGFDARRRYHLLVTLHGSGVDEIPTVHREGRRFAGDDTIVVGPRGRGLSDWWIGASEQDAIDALRAAKEMFRVSDVTLKGFSMGGYGAWRLSFRYPELFDRVVVLSGSSANLVDPRPEFDMMRRVGPSREVPYLVIHGTADRALDVADTDALVAKLRGADYDVTYLRIEGAGHGDYDVAEQVGEWIRSQRARPAPHNSPQP